MTPLRQLTFLFYMLFSFGPEIEVLIELKTLLSDGLNIIRALRHDPT